MTPATALLALAAPDDDFASRVALRPPGPDAVTWGRLAQDESALAELMDTVTADVPGADAKLAAAYLAGDLGQAVGALWGCAWLAGAAPAAIDPGGLAVEARAVPWVEHGESGVACVLDLVVDPAALEPGEDSAAGVGLSLEAMLAPLVATLARRSRLGAAALWRAAGDGLAVALLEAGQTCGREAETMALARAILGDRRLRLRSRQTEFVEIVLPAATGAGPAYREWFRLRGGCCRYYTSDGGEYCTTCVLRPRDQQIARLEAYLRERQAAD